MGGLVAEELFFGETGSGVAGDLQAATMAAAQMVGSFGMTGTLFSHDAVVDARHQPGGPGQRHRRRPGGDRRASSTRPGPTVRELLAAHRPVVEALRDALLDRDELVGDEITAIISAAVTEHDVLTGTAPATATAILAARATLNDIAVALAGDTEMARHWDPAGPVVARDGAGAATEVRG